MDDALEPFQGPVAHVVSRYAEDSLPISGKGRLADKDSHEGYEQDYENGP